MYLLGNNRLLNNRKQSEVLFRVGIRFFLLFRSFGFSLEKLLGLRAAQSHILVFHLVISRQCFDICKTLGSTLRIEVTCGIYYWNPLLLFDDLALDLVECSHAVVGYCKFCTKLKCAFQRQKNFKSRAHQIFGVLTL